MSDVELVIKIPKDTYIATCNESMLPPDVENVVNAIKNGTQLPKGCDIQRIIPKRVDVQKWIYTVCPNCERELSTDYGDGYYIIENKPDFCPNCGQALLWESEVSDADRN